jgi:hypothetical protein
MEQAVEIIKHRTSLPFHHAASCSRGWGAHLDPRPRHQGLLLRRHLDDPEYVRFLVRRKCWRTRPSFVPTYGNTLMGLAVTRSPKSCRENNYSVTYYAPQPRAVLRIVDPDKTEVTKEYGEYGRVELTTLTREFFMPRFPRARRGAALPALLGRLRLGRRRQRAPVRRDGEEDCRGRLLRCRGQKTTCATCRRPAACRTP